MKTTGKIGCINHDCEACRRRLRNEAALLKLVQEQEARADLALGDHATLQAALRALQLGVGVLTRRLR